MTVLIYAEHDNQRLKSDTAKLVNMATSVADEVHVVVFGYDCHRVVNQAQQIAGVTKVFVADHRVYAHQLVENISSVVANLAKGYTHVVASASSVGKSLMPRLAALLDVQPISEITSVVSVDTFERPIYAGNAYATVQSLDHIKVVTVRVSAFEPAELSATLSPIEVIDTVEQSQTTFVSETAVSSEKPDLTNADVVVSGGRAMQSCENFSLLERIADKLNGAVGATRAAVDAGYAPNDIQVGQTGKVVAPRLYIAAGISGAIQHLAGMKDSKVIVAINKDAEAPIFQVADYGIVGDVFTVLPELEAALSTNHQ